MRNARILAIALFAVLALAAIPSAALALPGDPPIESLGPADGSPLLVGEGGVVKVTFKCPIYMKGANESSNDIDYRVRFSSSSARDEEGLIGIDLGNAYANLEAGTTTCNAEFEPPLRVGPAALYQGTVYWQPVRQVVRPACPTCGPETLKQKEEREDKELAEEEKEEEASDSGTVFIPKKEYEGGSVRSLRSEATVEEPEFEFQRRISAGYLTPIGFTALSELTGATIELQRFTKGAWMSISQEAYGSPFYVKLPAGRQTLRAVAKSPTVSLALPLRKVMVHKLKHRLTSAEEDGRYIQKPRKKNSKYAVEEMPKLPLSFAVVDGGTRVVHLRASIEGTCTATTRSGQDVPLTIKTAIRSARIAPDGTVIADRKTKGPEPQQVTFVGQLLAGSLIGEVTTSFGRCTGSRKFEAIPKRKG